MIKSKLVKTLGIYTLSNLIDKAIPFLLLPFLTRFLTKAEYGLLANYQSILQFVLPIIGINAASAYTKHYFNKDFDQDKYISACLRLLLITSILSLAGIYGLSSIIEEYTQVPKSIYWTVILYSFFHNFSDLLLAKWRVKYKATKFAIFKILRTSIEALLSILLILSFDQNWLGRIEAQVIACSIFGLIAYFLLKQDVKFSFKNIKVQISQIKKYGLPLIPHVLGAVIIGQTDKIFVTKMVGIDYNGVYSAAFQISMVMSLFSNSFNQAWVPWFFEQLNLKSNSINKKIVKITYFYIIGIFLLISIFTLVGPLLFKILGTEFRSGIDFFFWIILGFGFNAIYKMFVNYIFYTEKTIYIAYLAIGTAASNIVLNYFLIKEFGAIGAAYATTISFAIQLFATIIIATKTYKMPWTKIK